MGPENQWEPRQMSSLESTHLEKRIITNHRLFKLHPCSLLTDSLSEHSFNNIQPVFMYGVPRVPQALCYTPGASVNNANKISILIEVI